MKTLTLSTFICALVLLTSTINYVKSQEANEILQKVDVVLYSAKDQQNKVTIILIDKN
jgi:hypothetical protein